jgi:hypothetical protein
MGFFKQLLYSLLRAAAANKNCILITPNQPEVIFKKLTHASCMKGLRFSMEAKNQIQICWQHSPPEPSFLWDVLQHLQTLHSYLVENLIFNCEPSTQSITIPAHLVESRFFEYPIEKTCQTDSIQLILASNPDLFEGWEIDEEANEALMLGDYWSEGCEPYSLPPRTITLQKIVSQDS